MDSTGGKAGSTSEAQHASYLLFLTGATGLLAITSQPERWIPIVSISALTIVLSGLIYALPADRTNPPATLAIAMVVFLALGIATWSAHDRALMTGPGFVLGFVWLGLHRSTKTILLAVPPATGMYATALWAAGTPAEGIGSAFVLIPIAGLAGIVMARNAAHLRQAKAEIKAEERWRAAIMAALAHDVRSPLTSITGALELLTDDPHTSTTHGPLLAAATRQGARIMRLATGLLEVERVDQGKLRLDIYEIQLRELVQEIIEGQPSMNVELDLSADLLVWADRERLEQVIVNLLGNATKHGAGPLVLSAASGAAGVEISVRDHGDGVPATDVEHLFERLGPTNGSTQSVGLGLWIVRLLAEAHGGTVRYESADPGARFIVKLPNGPVVEVDSHHSRPHFEVH